MEDARGLIGEIVFAFHKGPNTVGSELQLKTVRGADEGSEGT